MPAEARVTSIWKKQKLLAAIMFIAFGAYFFLDGSITYPHADIRYQAWKTYHDAGHMDEWTTFAQSKGWKVDEWDNWINDPHQKGLVPELRYGPGKILEQFVFGGLMVLIGLIPLAYWFTQKDRVVRTDEEAVYSPSGKRIPFETIIGLGKKKWEDKGFATVLYKIDGCKGRFLLDDYKYDRDATHQILAEIEEKLTARANP